jgi:ribosomal protein L24
MKYATITRGSYKGQQGKIINRDPSARTVLIELPSSELVTITENWVIVTSYDRSQAQVSRLFG